MPSPPSRRPGRPRKRFGQHFLEASWARKLVEAISPEPGEVFLEIGPGAGALTRPLAERKVPIVAVEIDRDLVARLASEVPPNVTVVSGDFLEVDILPILFGLLPQQRPPAFDSPDAVEGPSGRWRVRVVGNLPYNVTSPILFKLLALQKETDLFFDATLMVQREVADRLTARPGSKDYGVLAILVQLDAEVSRLLALPPGAFRPPPRVRSALVRLRFRPAPVPIADPDLFVALVRRLFTRRRKTVLNALRPFAAELGASPEAGLAIAGVRATRRPETLQLTELSRLVAFFASARRRPVL
jgi:16S rRNA (adenine1518-N6/adenine1519-N6)-dimethyltransferase